LPPKPKHKYLQIRRNQTKRIINAFFGDRKERKYAT